ncbi:hypothetical protein MHI24_23900 [Paenibacillus sp. FSL K6-1096]|uniref:hypothetical protein n=1 Tax=Paenibacillus sp. FSL K6-1096 TaxID=2921460 RepID=UPI0030EF8F00
MEPLNSSTDNSSDVTYTISTQYETYANYAIEASLITDIVNGFADDPDDFIVIEPSVPVERSLYMQAAPVRHTPHSIVVELRFGYPDGSFRHFSRLMTDRVSVIRMLLDYWGLQLLPAYSNWSDMTDKLS